jgi:hypothetical protein
MARERTSKELQHWNAAALALFLLLGALSLWLIARFGPAEVDLGFFDLAVLALASFRLTHLVTDDKIFDFVRALFFDERGGRLTKAQRGWRRVVCEVIECLWCAGLWSALFCITIYFLGFWGVFIDLLLAVAGLGSLLAVVSKAVAGSGTQ